MYKKVHRVLAWCLLNKHTDFHLSMSLCVVYSVKYPGNRKNQDICHEVSQQGNLLSQSIQHQSIDNMSQERVILYIPVLIFCPMILIISSLISCHVTVNQILRATPENICQLESIATQMSGPSLLIFCMLYFIFLSEFITVSIINVYKKSRFFEMYNCSSGTQSCSTRDRFFWRSWSRL